MIVPLRIVALVCPGQIQHHLLRRLAADHLLLGYITMSQRPPTLRERLTSCWTRYRNPLTFVKHLEARRHCRRSEAEAEDLKQVLFGAGENLPDLEPDVPHLHVTDVNSHEAIDLVARLVPECLVVYGTNLLRGPYFDGSFASNPRILNIHTGLSPYARGGNCNLFSILHGQLQHVGVTVHYINAGIDCGDIVYTARPTIEENDSFERLEYKVCRLGEDLLMLALRKLQAGEAPRVPQWTPGRLFLRRTGYVYEPHLRCEANNLLRRDGLLNQYFRNRDQYDEGVRVCLPLEVEESWRHAKA